MLVLGMPVYEGRGLQGLRAGAVGFGLSGIDSEDAGGGFGFAIDEQR